MDGFKTNFYPKQEDNFETTQLFFSNFKEKYSNLMYNYTERNKKLLFYTILRYHYFKYISGFYDDWEEKKSWTHVMLSKLLWDPENFDCYASTLKWAKNK